MRNRHMMRALVISTLSLALGLFGSAAMTREYNGRYEGPNLNRVAFPMGAMGAGMVCLEGTGAPLPRVRAERPRGVPRAPHVRRGVREGRTP